MRCGDAGTTPACAVARDEGNTCAWPAPPLLPLQSAESNPSGGNNFRGLYNIGLKSLGAGGVINGA